MAEMEYGHPPPPATNLPNIPPAGAQLSVVHAARAMNVYPITEPEVTSIGLFNALAAFGFAVGGIFLGFAAEIWISEAFSPSTQPVALLMVRLGAPVCAALAVMFFVLAVAAVIFRGSTWRTIKRASKPK